MPPTNPADDSAGMPEWMGEDETPEGLDLSGMLVPVEPAPPTSIPVPAVELPTPVPSPKRRTAVPLGEPFVYGAVVVLGSKVPSCEVIVEHEIPPNLKVLASSPVPYAKRGRTLIWKFERADVGAKFPIRIKAAAINGADWGDHGQATFRTSYVTRSSVAVAVVRPAVNVQLIGPNGVELGASTGITLKIRNTGTCPLRDIAIRIAATGGLTLLTDDAISFPGIPALGEATATLRVAARTAGPGSLHADVTAIPRTAHSAEMQCLVTTPKLDVSFAGPHRWQVNRDHSLRVVLRNSGTAISRMVGMRVAIPAGWIVSPVPEGFDAVNRVVFVQWDRLEPDASTELPLTIRPTLPGTGCFRSVVEDTTGQCEAELHANAELDPADSHSILERFVREVEFGSENRGVKLPASPRAVVHTSREHPHVIFAVADTEYAFPLGSVREIGRPPVSTPLPGSPDWLVGVANIRGGIVSMVDMRAFLDEKPGPISQDRRLMVVSATGAEMSAGILVDRVRGILSIPPDQVREPAAPIAARCSPYMAGIAALDRRSVIVLVPDRLLLAPEFLPFGAT